MKDNNKYVILDTNIIISFFLSKNKDSPIIIILNKIINNEIKTIISTEILKEYLNVLNRKKFNIESKIIFKFKNFIKQNSIKTKPKKLSEKFIDTKDLIFYEAYIENKQNNVYLITGNLKHFPKEKNIVSPREFINLFK